jgi:alpha-glucosidase (family GH31 glycosyl hydrolase)
MIWPLAVSLITAVWALHPLIQSSNAPYSVTNSTQLPYGWDLTLNYVPTIRAISEDVIAELLVKVRYVSADIVRVHITDSTHPRWEVPDVVNITTYYTGALNYTVAFSTQPFGLNVTRSLDNATILNIDPTQPFQYDDQDIILANYLNRPTQFYGIGERVTPNFVLTPGVYTTFNKDAASLDEGQQGGNMYSTHPFYLGVDNDTMRAFGGFLLNSNAMDTFIDEDYLLYRTIGGVIDYFAFVGPDPQSVMQQYHSLVGQPVLVPYWGMGWHQCRYGYANTSQLQWVLDNYTYYDLPLDVLWSDIDYMDQYKDFTVNPVAYAGLSGLVDTLHSMSKHYVPILDAGIGNSSSVAFNNGTTMDVFLKSPFNSSNFVGQVWPGPAVYVDWRHPNASSYWGSMLGYLHSQVAYDGIWLDMNEASNFCNGECSGDPAFNSSDIPYLPGGVSLNNKNIDLAVPHYGSDNVTEYDFHSLYGFYESIATSKYLQQTLNVRPFIISRSTFASNGKYAQHWLGDNFSEWEYLEHSIIGIFNFQMFGIPIVGADICGFTGNTTAEMCARWMQLGTLYPFSRNHNSINTIPQEPYALGNVTLAVSRMAIRNRYYLLNYLYTLMFAHALEGGVWFKPSFFQYSDDRDLFELHVSDNFMLGSDLLVHPVLTPNTTSLTAYFPIDIWYNLFTGQSIDTSISQLVTVNASLADPIPIHVRGGAIIPTLDLYDTVMNVMDLRLSNTTLIIALDANQQAEGRLILDDGKSLDSLPGAFYSKLEFSYGPFGSVQDVLKVQPVHSGYDLAVNEFPYISTLEIFGCTRQPYQVSFYNGSSVRRLLNVVTSFDYSTKLCRIRILDEVFTDSFGVFYISYS